jgi:hypothetical protein
MNRATYYNYIEERLISFSRQIELRGRINILDYHLYSENFYRDLLNKLYKWNLENLNSHVQNAEAVDLVDRTNHIVIQISAANTKSKIDNALSKQSLSSKEFNNLNASREIINDYKLYHHIVDKIYSEFDKLGCNRSISVLNTIRREYIDHSSKLFGDELFNLVISAISERVLQSPNFEKIPREEMEMCVGILAVDAFIRCKIFKNPNDYNHATA